MTNKDWQDSFEQNFAYLLLSALGTKIICVGMAIMTMPSWSRCSRDVGGYWILLTSIILHVPCWLPFASLPLTHLYQKRIFGGETRIVERYSMTSYLAMDMAVV